MRTHKYNAKKTEVDGIKFDSKAEARRYGELLLMKRGGEIKNLELQPKFQLFPKYVYLPGTPFEENIPAITYKADFRYEVLKPLPALVKRRGVEWIVDIPVGTIVVEDAKGHPTKEFLRSWKMVKFKYKDHPDYLFRIVKK